MIKFFIGEDKRQWFRMEIDKLNERHQPVYFEGHVDEQVKKEYAKEYAAFAETLEPAVVVEESLEDALTAALSEAAVAAIAAPEVALGEAALDEVSTLEEKIEGIEENGQ